MRKLQVNSDHRYTINSTKKVWNDFTSLITKNPVNNHLNLPSDTYFRILEKFNIDGVIYCKIAKTSDCRIQGWVYYSDLNLVQQLDYLKYYHIALVSNILEKDCKFKMDAAHQFKIGHVTIATYRNRKYPESLSFGFAFCHPNDFFSKKEGRIKAEINLYYKSLKETDLPQNLVDDIKINKLNNSNYKELVRRYLALNPIKWVKGFV